MWKSIVIIFLWVIFSGARGMLKSLRNHNSQREEMADWWGPMLRKKIIFHGHQIDCNWVWTSKQVGLEVNTIIEDVRGWRNSKRIELLLSSNDPTSRSQIEWAVHCECNTCIPSVVGIVNTGADVIQGKHWSSKVDKSIVISIIDGNVYRWVTAKCWFSQNDQKRRPIRSVASDCLTKIYDTVALNVIQKQCK